MRALVLSGGARKGAYQAGAVKHLMGEAGMDYDAFVGISVGAINAAFLAAHTNPVDSSQALFSLWKEVDNSKVRKPWYNGSLWYLPAFWKGSVYDSGALRDMVEKYLSKEAVRSSGKILSVGAVSLNSGKYRTFREDFEALHDAVLASSAFPGFLEDVEIEGELYTDGGVRNVVPVHDAIELGATEIDVIVTGPLNIMGSWETSVNVIDKAKRVVDIMSDEIFSNDLIEYCHSCGIQVRILAPEMDFGGDPLDFDDRDKLDQMLLQGYTDSLKNKWHAL